MLDNNNLCCTESHVTILKHFVYRWQMNITAKFELLSMIQDIEHYNINIETSLTVHKIIQA